MKKIIVCGAGGFVGHHLARRLKNLGNYVIGLDLHYPEFCSADDVSNEFHLHDCRTGISDFLQNVEEVYQLAADMGGAGYIFTGNHDADIMSNSAMINLQILKDCVGKIQKIFFSSSACVYPEYNQLDSANPVCTEESAYPAQPDSEYGWEKLFSERLYQAYYKNYGLRVAIGRFHNVYGPECAYNNGKEKAVMAISRKILTPDNVIQIWGSGSQTRSFLYIDDCIDGIMSLMASDYTHPLNIGSEEKISINDLAKKIMCMVGKNLEIMNVDGPVGVNGRTSDNTRITQVTGWSPRHKLEEGLKKTLNWLEQQLR